MDLRKLMLVLNDNNANELRKGLNAFEASIINQESLLNEYLAVSPNGLELMNTWGHEQWTKDRKLIEAHTSVVLQILKASPEGIQSDWSRRILTSSHHLQVIWTQLKWMDKPAAVATVLGLCTTLCKFQSKLFYRIFDLNNPVLEKLLKKGASLDLDIRTQLTDFILTCLNSDVLFVQTSLMKNGMVASLFDSLEEDCHTSNLDSRILSVVLLKLLKNDAISASAKYEMLFYTKDDGDNSCSCVMQRCLRRMEKEDDVVSQHLYSFWVTIFRLFFIKPDGTSVPSYVLKSFNPTTCNIHLKLLLLMAREHPTVAIDFLKAQQWCLEPRLSYKWFASSSVFLKLSSTISTSNTFSRVTLGQAFEKKDLSKGLLHSENFIKYQVSGILISILQNALNAKDDTTLESQLKSYLPTPESVVSNITKVKEVMLQCRLLKLLTLYFKVLPRTMESLRIDVNKILPAWENFSTYDSTLQLAMVQLVNALDSKRIASGILSTKMIQHVLPFMVLSSHDAALRCCVRKAVRHVLSETGFFGKTRVELDCWLDGIQTVENAECFYKFLKQVMSNPFGHLTLRKGSVVVGSFTLMAFRNIGDDDDNYLMTEEGLYIRFALRQLLLRAEDPVGVLDTAFPKTLQSTKRPRLAHDNTTTHHNQLATLFKDNSSCEEALTKLVSFESRVAFCNSHWNECSLFQIPKVSAALDKKVSKGIAKISNTLMLQCIAFHRRRNENELAKKICEKLVMRNAFTYSKDECFSVCQQVLRILWIESSLNQRGKTVEPLLQVLLNFTWPVIGTIEWKTWFESNMTCDSVPSSCVKTLRLWSRMLCDSKNSQSIKKNIVAQLLEMPFQHWQSMLDNLLANETRNSSVKSLLRNQYVKYLCSLSKSSSTNASLIEPTRAKVSEIISSGAAVSSPIYELLGNIYHDWKDLRLSMLNKWKEVECANVFDDIIKCFVEKVVNSEGNALSVLCTLVESSDCFANAFTNIVETLVPSHALISLSPVLHYTRNTKLISKMIFESLIPKLRDGDDDILESLVLPTLTGVTMKVAVPSHEPIVRSFTSTLESQTKNGIVWSKVSAAVLYALSVKSNTEFTTALALNQLEIVLSHSNDKSTQSILVDTIAQETNCTEVASKLCKALSNSNNVDASVLKWLALNFENHHDDTNNTLIEWLVSRIEEQTSSDNEELLGTLDLLRKVLANCSDAAILQNVVYALLCRYDATLSPVDKTISRLLSSTNLLKVTSSTLEAVSYKWNSVLLASSNSLNSKVTSAAKAVLNDDQKWLFEAGVLDAPRMRRTIEAFPSHRAFDGEHLEESDETACRYDPWYLLRVISYLLYQRSWTPSKKFVQSGCVGFLVMCCTSKCLSTRKIAYGTLAHILSCFELADNRTFPEQQQLVVLLKSLQNTTENAFAQIPYINALFMNDAALVLIKPEHDLYVPLNHFLLSRSSMDFMDVPMFYTLFQSSHPTSFTAERLWILQVLHRGVRTLEDVEILKRRHVAPMLMTFYQSSVSDSYTSSLIMKLLARVAAVDAEYIQSIGIFAWIDKLLLTKSVEDYDSSSIVSILKCCKDAGESYSYQMTVMELFSKLSNNVEVIELLLVSFEIVIPLIELERLVTLELRNDDLRVKLFTHILQTSKFHPDRVPCNFARWKALFDTVCHQMFLMKNEEKGWMELLNSIESEEGIGFVNTLI